MLESNLNYIFTDGFLKINHWVQEGQWGSRGTSVILSIKINLKKNLTRMVYVDAFILHKSPYSKQKHSNVYHLNDHSNTTYLMATAIS